MRIVILFLCLLPLVSFSQNPFVATPLSDNINSSYNELRPVLSPNDSVLYFARVNHPQNKYGVNKSQDIWYSQLNKGGDWSIARRMPDALNLGRYNALFAIIDSGRTFIISGVYTKSGEWKKRGISKVRLEQDGTWSSPEEIKVNFNKINEGNTSDVFFSQDGSVMIVSSSKAYQSENNKLFVIQNKNNRWQQAKMLKIKSGKKIMSPFLSADKSQLYFSSENEQGKHELYKCEKQDGTMRYWSKPERLNDTINIGDWNAYFVTNKKGDIAYYSSKNNGNTNLYKVRLFEDKPYVSIGGSIVHAVTNSLFSEASYEIVVEEIDSIVGSDSADVKVFYSPELNRDDTLFNVITDLNLVEVKERKQYAMKLGLGKKYRVRALSEAYVAEPVIIDLTNEYEYHVIEQDLALKSLDYVLMKGELYDSLSCLTLLNSNPSFFINGTRVNDIVSDSTGGFEFKLPIGTNMVFTVAVQGYQKEEFQLDLRDQKGFKEIDRDIYLKPMLSHKIGVTVGVVNQTDKKPLHANSELTLLINNKRMAFDSTKNSSVLNWSLELDLDSSYVLKIIGEEFMSLEDSVFYSSDDFSSDTIVTVNYEVKKLKVGVEVVLQDVLFDKNKSELLPASFSSLNQLADYLNQNGKITIEIGGHTDNVGSSKANKLLSELRAKSVASYLTSRGVSKKRLIVKGYGFDKPMASNDTDQGKKINRRVGFTVLQK